MKTKQTCELCGDDKCTCDKDIRIYFCPKCKSYNVRYVFGLKNIFGIIPKMKCFDCGFENMGFPMLVTNKRKIEEAKKKLIKRKGNKK
ncbi:MAG: hypothetical protein WC548_01725 [Candidatus Pacearchaeota archaeon]